MQATAGQPVFYTEADVHLSHHSVLSRNCYIRKEMECHSPRISTSSAHAVAASTSSLVRAIRSARSSARTPRAPPLSRP